MNAKIGLIVGAALLCCMLAGCGGTQHTPVQTMGAPPPPPPPPTTKDLDTAAVLAIVQMQTSETSEPFEVDNAAIAVTPIGDEAGAPVNVNAT